VTTQRPPLVPPETVLQLSFQYGAVWPGGAS
jgi:hypothetical protein